MGVKGATPGGDDRDALVAALESAGARNDRITAIERYRAYETQLAVRGEEPDEGVVQAYRNALWRPRAKADGRADVLPHPVTPYFERPREAARILEGLGTGSLVTIVGPPGVGKTRLALAVAQRARKSFAGDLRYIELRAAEEAEAQFARATEGDDEAVLLVVDNAESLLDAAQQRIAAFRERRPSASVLVTSRVRLGLPGERAVEIAPFALPLTAATPAVIARTPSIAFFVERATLARPDIFFDEEDAVEIAALCAALDGLPLALELAAAQLRFFSLAELGRRVRRTDFGPTSLETTLRSTLELLDAPERTLFHRLAVFEAPWTITEAEAVCAGDGLMENEVLPAMMGLVERSLVQSETSGEVVRYRLLETIRRVALAEGEADRVAARARAVAWVLGWMSRPGLDGIPDPESIAALDERLELVRAVLDRWCADPRAVLRAIASTRKYWEWRGLAAESLRRVDARRAAIADDADDALRFAVARTRATHALIIGDNRETADAVAEMHALSEPQHDTARLVEAWNNAAILAYNEGRLDEAVRLLEAVASLQAERGATIDGARTVMNLAAIDLAERDWERAEARLASIAHLPHARNEAVFVARNRAYAAAMRGELIAARAFADEAARRAAEPGVAVEWRIEVEHVLGIIAARSGDPYTAIKHQQQALLVVDRPPLRMAALPLEHAAIAARELGRIPEAAQLLAFVDEGRRREGLARSAAFERFFEEVRSSLAAALGDRYPEHAAVGRALAPERAAEIAFSLPTEAPQALGLAGLSEREREVAALIAEGLTNREIAARLFISAKTVEHHLGAIFGKLHVSRRAQLAVLIRDGRGGANSAE